MNYSLTKPEQRRFAGGVDEIDMEGSLDEVDEARTSVYRRLYPRKCFHVLAICASGRNIAEKLFSKWRFQFKCTVIKLMDAMRSLVRKIRERFHPLFYARKSPLGRFAIRILDQPAWLSVEGVTFKVRGRILTHGLAFGITGSQEKTSEAMMTACIRHLPLRSFWDVGANIGYYTWLVKSARPEIEAVLMEPLPENAALIAETIRRNRPARTTLISKAASSSNGYATLTADTMAGATSSLEVEENTFERTHWNAVPKAIKVPIVTIDATRDGFGPIDLMKIDVEGHEESVLAGAQKAIATDQPIILIECGHNDHRCLSPLENMGYTVMRTEDLNFFCVPLRYQSDLHRIASVSGVPPCTGASATARRPT